MGQDRSQARHPPRSLVVHPVALHWPCCAALTQRAEPAMPAAGYLTGEGGAQPLRVSVIVADSQGQARVTGAAHRAPRAQVGSGPLRGLHRTRPCMHRKTGTCASLASPSAPNERASGQGSGSGLLP